MSEKYLVNVGINYPPERRAEPGDEVDDIPEQSIEHLLEQGVISLPGEAPDDSEESTSPSVHAVSVSTEPEAKPAPEAEVTPKVVAVILPDPPVIVPVSAVHPEPVIPEGG